MCVCVCSIQQAFGHENVHVLQGGFPRWVAEGFPVEDGDFKPPFEVRSRSEGSSGIVLHYAKLTQTTTSSLAPTQSPSSIHP